LILSALTFLSSDIPTGLDHQGSGNVFGWHKNGSGDLSFLTKNKASQWINIISNALSSTFQAIIKRRMLLEFG